MAWTGGCLCGAVRWAGSEAPTITRVCWCRDCQYLAAGSGTVNACFAAGALTITGATTSFHSTADSGNRMHRRFCGRCGTPLFSAAESRPGLVFVRVGSFDDPGAVTPSVTIWTASAPAWACLDPATTQVQGQPPPLA